MRLNEQQFGQLDLFAAPTKPDVQRSAVTETRSGAKIHPQDWEGGPPPQKRWSGPSAGQHAAGPHLEDTLIESKSGPLEGHMHADEHGNFNEDKILGGWDPSAEIESVYDKNTRQMLMVGAQSRPTQQMRADHPLHTLQPVTETETLYDLHHGPERRKNLEASVAERGVDKPILLVKHQGRHVIIDGHHRLLAARKAGLEHVPVKIFDHDEHVHRGGANVIGDPMDDPYGHDDDDDLYSHDEGHSDISEFTHSDNDREPSGWT